ncbi:sulfatase-like hydrolase/transferase [Pontiellaceae bacterium B1224]|nr:sulfatase-like hydrolase/transferase [Pontiellaceae bacterium B1224]
MKLKSVATALTLFCILGASLADAGKPNILFIFADDMCYESIGAYGLEDIDTPNLDKLVSNGMSFTHAYNMGAWGGAVCVASRKMLNTGLFVWRSQQANLNQYVSDRKMWSQRLSDAGYQTYLTGKWHVSTPAPQIFDHAKNIRKGMPEQVPSGYNRPKNEEDYKKGWKPWDPKHGGFWQGGKHWSEVLADDSIEFLNQAAEDDQPFFMYLAFNAPHDPRQAPKEYIDRYPLDRIKLPENFQPEYPYLETICGKIRDEQLAPFPRTEYSIKVNRQEYYALITHMDEQIGKIFQALEKTGKADNTYIVFTADHGLAVGHHGLVGKQNMYEHSVRVPFLVKGPGVKAGSKNDTPIYLQDIVPTTLGWAGAGTDDIDFKTLKPLLQGKTGNHYDSIYGAYMKSQRMVLKDNWKLIVYPGIGLTRLFNIAKDPLEMNDLAAHPEYTLMLKELSDELESKMDELSDPMASIVIPDRPAPKKKKRR